MPTVVGFCLMLRGGNPLEAFCLRESARSSQIILVAYSNPLNWIRFIMQLLFRIKYQIWFEFSQLFWYNFFFFNQYWSLPSIWIIFDLLLKARQNRNQQVDYIARNHLACVIAIYELINSWICAVWRLHFAHNRKINFRRARYRLTSVP